MTGLGLWLMVAALQQEPADSTLRRRLPTVAEQASAFRDEETRRFVARARLERQRVDSSLESYRATAYERISAGGSIGPVSRERALARRESVGEVTWSRAAGAYVQMKGQRRMRSTAMAMPNPVGDLLVPVPWYPGMDALWLPSPNGPTGRAGRETEVDTTELVHPLTEGSEAYYTFALGDSVSITLGDGRRIALRELRARPRQPKWNLSIGSYWFDTDRAQLVRAIYRMSVPYDVWFETDNALGKGEKGPPWYLRALVQPLKAELQAVTLEYGLYGDRFWLPRVRRVDGTVRAGPAQAAVTIEQGFKYSDVNAVVDVPALPAANLAVRALYDSLNTPWQQLWRDRRTLRSAADSARWQQRRAVLDSGWAAYNTRAVAQRDRDCASGGVRYQTGSRLGNLLKTRIAVPCDSAALANAPELAGGLLATREEIYASTLGDATRTALGLDEQSAFAPQRISRHLGVEYMRFNRIEALSIGGALRQQLGAGWNWEANARASFGDGQANGELIATRSNGGASLTLAAYRRLTQADDYGLAFGPFASLQNMLGAQDEQFYFRAVGAEAVWSRTGRGVGSARVETRLFAESQRGVSTQARVSLPWLLDRSRSFDEHVTDTLPYTSGATVGAQWRLLAARGQEQEGWRTGSALRLEGATGTWTYARAAIDLSVGRALPHAIRLNATGSGGTSLGVLPVHRWWNLGGWQTLRGQRAGARRGDAFWMTRGEVIWARTGWIQPGAFVDAGWAGPRQLITRGDAVLTSIGGGVGLLGLPVRIDAARALGAGGSWRVDVYAPIRF